MVRSVADLPVLDPAGLLAAPQALRVGDHGFCRLHWVVISYTLKTDHRTERERQIHAGTILHHETLHSWYKFNRH
jgi:hypothetical protein